MNTFTDILLEVSLEVGWWAIHTFVKPDNRVALMKKYSTWLLINLKGLK